MTPATKKTPKLPLTQDEKSRLREFKVKLSDIHKQDPARLAKILKISRDRARMLIGLAAFQKIPSIGPELASKLVSNLGMYSLDDLKDKEGGELLDRLEISLGCWTDPCVEDQIRCVIHHANHPDSEKQWFDFTKERKDYRETYGYPNSRPKIPWYQK